jgi:RimJ/RimL family protein N-acetyltransferase
VFEIRPARPTDAPALARVHIASWQAAYRGLLPDDVLDGLSLDSFESSWKSHLLNPQRTNLVLEVEGQVGGFVAFGVSRDEEATPEIGEVYALYLTPELWGMGYGHSLWQRATEDLQTQYSTVVVRVLRDNKRARAFYSRMGLTCTEETQDRTLFGVELPEVCYRGVL